MDNSKAKNWNKRALSQGHTGWGNSSIYNYDQPSRIHSILKIIDSLPFPINGFSILDFGCGTGDFSSALAKLGAKVTGIDISDVVIGKAQQVYGNKDNITFEISSDSFFIKNPEMFDIVMSITVMQHLDDFELKKTLGQIYEVTSPGAYLLVLEMVRGAKNFDDNTSPIPRGHDDWLREFGNFGFELIKTSSYPQWAITILSNLARSVRPKQKSGAFGNLRAKPSTLRKIVTRVVLMTCFPLDRVLKKSTPVALAPYNIFLLRRPLGE